MIYLYVYGAEAYYVRVGFTGTRPLVYAVYAVNREASLPHEPGQIYHSITEDQYDWLRGHIACDVSYIWSECLEKCCDLECRTCRCKYNVLAGSEGFVPDSWFDRQV